MTVSCVSHWMTSRSFRDEFVRRATLDSFRMAAARSGYRGRITFDWDDLHGRKRHLGEGVDLLVGCHSFGRGVWWPGGSPHPPSRIPHPHPHPA